MWPAPKLRACERALTLLAWVSFGLGALAILFLSLEALLTQRAPAPEDFLTGLAVILVASLVPTLCFQLLAEWCRRRRARLPAALTENPASFHALEDSTLGG
jgi:hypothetical protein